MTIRKMSTVDPLAAAVTSIYAVKLHTNKQRYKFVTIKIVINIKLYIGIQKINSIGH